jgi:hypothetical protein
MQATGGNSSGSAKPRLQCALPATERTLTIQTTVSSEIPPASVPIPGTASVPLSVFYALVQGLRFRRGPTIEFAFSNGEIVILNQSHIRHPEIVVVTKRI